MKNKISPDLLQRFLRGEATPEESTIVDNWFQSMEDNPDDERLSNPMEHERVKNDLLDRIKVNILLEKKQLSVEQSSHPISLFFRSSFKWAAAIGTIVAVGIGAFVFLNQKARVQLSEKPGSENQIERISNNTSSVVHQLLEDGTLIKLHPHSSIEFPKVFALTKREVHLTGEAFFDVSKNKKRPFIINTGDITIRVLGTSFNVKAYQGANEIVVAVKTGRVSVSSNSVRNQKSQNKSVEEIILTPNQKVVYDKGNENFLKKLVDEPQVIKEKTISSEMKFDGAPVSKILEALEESYGISIVYDRSTLSGCTLTTFMAEEGFYERIEIICKAIDAQYEVVDDYVVIKSKGCR